MNRQLTNERSRRGYERLAPYYWWLEHGLFGSRLQAARVRLLHEIPEVESVLVLGDGDGRFIGELARSQPKVSLFSVDQSEMMLELQRARIAEVPYEGKITFQACDLRKQRFPRHVYGGLVANFLLDCFSTEELIEHLPYWLSAVQPGGFFYFSDFTVPPSGLRRVGGRMLLFALHQFFRIQTGLPNTQLPNFNEVFSGVPIKRHMRVDTFGGLMRTEIYCVG